MSEAFFQHTLARPSRSAIVSTSAMLMGVADRVPSGPARFLVAGGMTSTINWLVRFPLSVGLPYGVAVALAYAVGMVAGFGLYRSWVFPGSPLSLSAQIVRFILVNVAGLSCVVLGAQMLAALIAGTHLVALPLAEAGAHGLAIVLGAVVNFMGHRLVTFARTSGLPLAMRRVHPS